MLTLRIQPMLQHLPNATPKEMLFFFFNHLYKLTVLAPLVEGRLAAFDDQTSPYPSHLIAETGVLPP